MHELYSSRPTMGTPAAAARIELEHSAKKVGTLEFLGQMLPRSHREIAFHKKLEQERKAAKEEPARQSEWDQPALTLPPCETVRSKPPESTKKRLSQTGLYAF